jgi:hypothetical protein
MQANTICETMPASISQLQDTQRECTGGAAKKQPLVVQGRMNVVVSNWHPCFQI